jgi:hypothetical protein
MLDRGYVFKFGAECVRALLFVRIDRICQARRRQFRHKNRSRYPGNVTGRYSVTMSTVPIIRMVAAQKLKKIRGKSFIVFLRSSPVRRNTDIRTRYCERSGCSPASFAMALRPGCFRRTGLLDGAVNEGGKFSGNSEFAESGLELAMSMEAREARNNQADSVCICSVSGRDVKVKELQRC